MSIDLLPLAGRPAYARKMIAVWRLHHLAAGDELTVTVWPGEWPDAPREVQGVPVVEDERVGGPESMMILGRVGTAWRVAYNHCYRLAAELGVDDLALTTAFLELDENRDMRLWLSPSPETGEVPMWSITRRAGGDQ